jgi:hypothetical protein
MALNDLLHAVGRNASGGTKCPGWDVSVALGDRFLVRTPIPFLRDETSSLVTIL